MTTLRSAAEEDYARLTIIWAEGWDVGHLPGAPKELVKLRTAASFHARLRGFGTDLRVMGPRGAPTGFVALKTDKIDQFYISLDQVGTGLAMTLMQAAEEELRIRGTTTASLECADDNHRAFAFYRKAGWAPRGREEITVDTSKGPFKLYAIILEKQL